MYNNALIILRFEHVDANTPNLYSVFIARQHSDATGILSVRPSVRHGLVFLANRLSI